MKMRKGCTVPFPDALTEGYEIHETGFIANVSADKIRDVMEHFVAIHGEPMFFILEIPSRYDDESDNGDGTVSSFHKDVYYIDGCSKEEALAILDRSSSVLINDGLCSFGFGCHDSRDEIIFGKYNVTTVFTENKQRFSFSSVMSFCSVFFIIPPFRGRRVLSDCLRNISSPLRHTFLSCVLCCDPRCDKAADF